jgi:cupin 2 domain-containing protein
MTNLFANLPSYLPEELITPLNEAGTVRVERIVSHGHASPPGFWYDQDRPE